MKCKRCGKEIEENEVFCDDCKDEMKDASSKKEVEELEDLIEDHEKLNELENTKELKNLNEISEENKEEVIEELPTREELHKDDVKPKKNKKALIITLIVVGSIVVLGLIILSVVLTLRMFSKNKQNFEGTANKKINYEEVINDYGKSLEETSKKYLSENSTVLTWQQLSELVKYGKYDVSCETHNIYKDGSIYLESCKVNDKNTKYTYGTIKEEKKDGKKITIYKLDYSNGYYSYSDKRNNGASEVATLTCETMDCKYINAYDKYALIKENNHYYLYNYENDSIEFGPFDMYDDYSYATDLLVNNNKLYGVIYKENNKKNIYNVTTGKTIKDVKGELLFAEMNFDPSIMYKYNYAVLEDNNTYNFVNLKTGNVSYSITGNLGDFIEDEKNKLVYMTIYDENYESFTLYNSNGKQLFNGNNFTKVNIDNGNIIVSNKNSYQVYDSNLKLKTSSKNYDEVLGLYSDFIVVLDNNHLEILDTKDSILATFDFEWDKNRYTFHSMLSGWYKENGKNGIYLVVEDKTIPFGTLGSGLEYYYIPDTKEVGVIKTEGVGGYAKPIIYLYPEEKTDVTVTFENPNLLTTTYPKFKNSWKVTANPNGDLYDLNGNYYYGLYFEEEGSSDVDFTEGFYVTKASAIDFLEEKLSIIGLNPKERNEFIMYWLPILEKNEKSLVYFELTEERDKYNKLIINPKPDSVLRVAIHIKKVNKKTSIKEEKLKTFKRSGFTVVEWGGVIH